MKPITFISACLCCLFLSCKKESKPTLYTFPLTLRLAVITQNSDVLVYTKDGQITDKAVIAKFSTVDQFLLDTIHSTVFNVGSDINVYRNQPEDTLNFIAKDTLMFGHTQDLGGGIRETAEKFSIKQNGTQFLFYSQYNIEQYPFAANLFKYNYPVTDTTFYTDEYYNRWYLNKNTWVGYGTFDAINMSYTCFKLVKRTAQGSYLISYRFFNEFNPDFVKTLGSGDTVAYQRYTFTYKK